MTNLPQSTPEQPNSSVPPAGISRPEDIAQTDDRTGDPALDGDADAPVEDGNSPLFPSQQCKNLEREWQMIQANFVDSPRSSVEQADALVKKSIDTLASSFGEMRSSLEGTWERDGDVSTEELRLALQNYRSFFRRILSL